MAWSSTTVKSTKLGGMGEKVCSLPRVRGALRAICGNIEPSVPRSKVELGAGMAIFEITFPNALPWTCFQTVGWIA